MFGFSPFAATPFSSLPVTAVGPITYAVSVAETSTATVAINARGAFSSALLEVATGTDVAAAIVAFTTQVLETTTATDVTLVGPYIYGARIAEAATALEALFPAGVLNVQFVDSVTALDTVLGAYLWNPIDDNQTPNWQNVNNAQGSGWVSINTDDAPNWQPTIQP
jgi:hypothetical protein